MTETEIKAHVARTLGRIAPEADLEAVAPDENLREALELDSIDFLHLLIGLSEELGVEIPESDYGQLRTLSDITRYLAAHTA